MADSQQQIEAIRASRETVAASLGPLSLLTTIAYTALAVAHPFAIGGRNGWIMLAVAGISALVAAGIHSLFRLWKQTNREFLSHAFLMLGILVGLCLFNTALHMALVPEIRHTGNYVAFSLILGLAMTSRRWFYCYLAISVASWIATVALHNIQDITQWATIYFFASVFAIILHEQRLYSSRASARRIDLLRRRTEALQALSQSPELAHADLEAASKQICRTSSNELNAHRVSIWLFGEDQQSIRCTYLYSQDADTTSEQIALKQSDFPAYFSALKDNRTLAANNALTDPRTSEMADSYLRPTGVGALMDAPIRIRGEIVGVVCHEHIGESRNWSVEDQTFAGSIADVTAFAIQAQEWSAMVKRNLESERLESLGVLAGGVAHDFNNLLTVVIGHGELLEEMLPTQGEAQNSVRAILEASSKARELASQMLGYAGRASFITRVVDLSELVRELGEFLRQDLSSNMRIVDATSGGNLPINVDPTQIRQVLLNMLTNAKDAGASQTLLRTGQTELLSNGQVTDKPDAESSYITSTEMSAGHYAWFEVEDNGCGMDAKTLNRIFDPFFTSKDAGTGLGLAAVLGILRAHNGSVDVFSTRDRGTLFRIYLPLSDQYPERAKTEIMPSTDHADGGGIILVEDDLQVQKLATIFLERINFQVFQFSGCNELKEALPTLNNASINCALVDLTLGDGDGVEVIGNIRKTNPALPIVLMSGYDSSNALSRLADRSGVTFLPKPFTQQNLQEAINRVLEGDTIEITN